MLLSICISFVFFKQKTAYEMRISDWSSDVCSSDLQAHLHLSGPASACSGPRSPHWRGRRACLLRRIRPPPPCRPEQGSVQTARSISCSCHLFSSTSYSRSLPNSPVDHLRFPSGSIPFVLRSPHPVESRIATTQDFRCSLSPALTAYSGQ